MPASQKKVLVIGAFASGSKYTVRVITRDASSPSAKELESISGVEIFEGDSYDEPTLRKAFAGVDYAFVNTNGFAIGEKAEIYWGIRMYELAREFGLKHFIYAGLEYASKLGNFDPKYKCGHLDGKAKVAEYLSAQPTTPMAWSVLTSCLYMEGLSEVLCPYPDPRNPGTLIFAAPLGNAKLPLIYLKDYGDYARWMLDTPARSNGLNLHVATEDISWADLTTAFTELTGIKSVYKDVTLDEYFKLGAFANPEVKVGHSVTHDDPTLVTIRENFSGFWNTWKAELTKRDYKLLDEILPTRVKSVKEWMEKTGYKGEPAPVLKDYRDGAPTVSKYFVLVQISRSSWWTGTGECIPLAGCRSRGRERRAYLCALNSTVGHGALCLDWGGKCDAEENGRGGNKDGCELHGDFIGFFGAELIRAAAPPHPVQRSFTPRSPFSRK
ncbi:hypothetical protein V495_01803 [Pseudogymnoascus sp. VKM F-4514 (FW-929)]|nr:hypothetical protein V495_01803 [Pseudogymnoascus sp. VKM F-4514 (FW-929)]KFY62604.1 hypothetical protein V497_02289 [Pseudogymnoascus sp. VKM F-4516 (FW-969)]